MTGRGKEKLERLKAFQEKHVWALPLAFCVFSFLFFFPFLFAVEIPQYDVLARYVPMAEAFAAGDWVYAFHPRVPPFLPVLGGIFVFFTGCGGFFGVKLASLLCFSLSFLALFPLMRRVFGLRTAVTACLLAVFSSHVLRLAFSGLRETGKGLFILWAAYALVRLWQEKKSLKASLMLALACAGMVYVRDDSVLYALVFLVAGCGIELFRTRRFPAASLLLAPLTVLVLILPLLTLNYHITGYPVPSARFVRFAKKVLPFRVFTPESEWPSSWMVAPPLCAEKRLPGRAVRDSAASAAPSLRTSDRTSDRAPAVLPELFCFSWKAFGLMLLDLARGLYPYYLIPALVMIALRIKRKEWTPEETLLLLVVLLHGALLMLQIAVADGWFLMPRRYSLPVSPLLCGWTALALLLFYNKTRQAAEDSGKPGLLRVHSSVFAAALVVLAGLLLFDSLAPEIRNFTSEKKNITYRLLLDWQEEIRRDYRGPARCEKTFYDEERYRSYRRPQVISGTLQKLGGLAGGENVSPRFDPRDRRHPAERIPESLALQRRQGFPADYLAEEVPGGEGAAPPQFKGYEILDQRVERGRKFVLWKNVKPYKVRRNGKK